MSLFLQTNNYRLYASVKPLARPPGHFHLKLTSQLLSAKNPHAQHTLLSVTADAHQLTALADVIRQGCAPNNPAIEGSPS